MAKLEPWTRDLVVTGEDGKTHTITVKFVPERACLATGKVVLTLFIKLLAVDGEVPEAAHADP